MIQPRLMRLANSGVGKCTRGPTRLDEIKNLHLAAQAGPVSSLGPTFTLHTPTVALAPSH